MLIVQTQIVTVNKPHRNVVLYLEVLVNLKERNNYCNIVNHIWIFQTAMASLMENMITFGTLK